MCLCPVCAALPCILVHTRQARFKKDEERLYGPALPPPPPPAPPPPPPPPPQRGSAPPPAAPSPPPRVRSAPTLPRRAPPRTPVPRRQPAVQGPRVVAHRRAPSSGGPSYILDGTTPESRRQRPAPRQPKQLPPRAKTPQALHALLPSNWPCYQLSSYDPTPPTSAGGAWWAWGEDGRASGNGLGDVRSALQRARVLEACRYMRHHAGQW